MAGLWCNGMKVSGAGGQHPGAQFGGNPFGFAALRSHSGSSFCSTTGWANTIGEDQHLVLLSCTPPTHMPPISAILGC